MNNSMATATSTLEPRMTNPAVVIPDAMKALQAFGKAAKRGGVPQTTASFVHLQASQINGGSFCVEMHSAELKEAGEADERIYAVAAWRDAPYFTDAERAALALTEAVTRLSDRADPVPDDVWEEATHHYDEPALAALLIEISTINTWNRLNVTTRQIAGAWPADTEGSE